MGHSLRYFHLALYLQVWSASLYSIFYLKLSFQRIPSKYLIKQTTGAGKQVFSQIICQHHPIAPRNYLMSINYERFSGTFRVFKYFVWTLILFKHNVSYDNIFSDKYIECYHIVWIKLISLSAAYMRQWIGSALAQIMACRLFGTKALSKPMLDYC